MTQQTIYNHTLRIKRIASQLGFDFCGIAKAVPLDEDAKRLENWLNQGRHANMRYMENHFELRVNPQKLVPGAQSVITLLLNYFPENNQNVDAPKIAKYAYGNDYHTIIKDKLKQFLKDIEFEIGSVSGRGFVDSAPVLERTWATKSGLGFIGKNGNLINRSLGSYFFIATLITDLQLEPDAPVVEDFCGTCTRCIDVCPTEAILPDKVIDSNRCISYHTIELKDSIIDKSFAGKFDNWMFGCDVCQDVCPWNRFAKPTQARELKPIDEVINFSRADWDNLQQEVFEFVFKKSALKRAKFSGIKRNLQFLKLVDETR